MNLSKYKPLLKSHMKYKECTSTCLQSAIRRYIQKQISVYSTFCLCCFQWFLEAHNTSYCVSRKKFLNPRTSEDLWKWVLASIHQCTSCYSKTWTAGCGHRADLGRALLYNLEKKDDLFIVFLSKN